MALIIPPRVARQFATMPRADARRLCERLDRVAAEPGVTAMVGMPGTLRVRQRDWRAINAIKDGNVIIGQVGNRREVHR